jgi:hypothetical protein
MLASAGQVRSVEVRWMVPLIILKTIVKGYKMKVGSCQGIGSRDFNMEVGQRLTCIGGKNICKLPPKYTDR